MVEQYFRVLRANFVFFVVSAFKFIWNRSPSLLLGSQLVNLIFPVRS